ncbi:PIN domain-containing protein [Singulisphaera sp. GP187]|uniref:PIN domain-containing protein n=1 Tax=Singulisphaera sp. GP187 TaxID=1882752 RepID=UPI000927C178|nr:PIN domain-containing protein [Singulisphaera sp. GP187]SIN67959.1 PIN domain-containing protein [Singulisphaera sp. GP187]
MTTFTAVYDACVLYPAPLRDLLMQLALTDLVRARWSDMIHEEWIRNVLMQRPDLTRTQLESTRDLMNRHVRDGLVAGFEGLIPSLALPDPNDRHVLAAAIQCGAGVIVTFNLKDFPPECLNPYGVEARHPDDFIADLFDLNAAAVCIAIKTLRARLTRPPRTAEEYLETLERQRLTETVAALRDYVGLL